MSRFYLPALLRRAGAAMALACATAVSLAAQGGTIKGKVTDLGTGRPLDEAQVVLLGSPRGTRTNGQGEYTLPAVTPGTYNLRAQRIGNSSQVKSVTVVAGQTVTVDFALTPAPISLGEVVVTGTAAEVRKKEIGNSMAAISSKSFEDAPVTNTQDILGGRAPGVTVMANGGQPGTGGTIRLRGNNSISMGNNPVVYIDGVRIYSENGPVALASRQGSLTMNDLRADDIERIEIVKGAAATTLYGTEASGGVVQIFTKKGLAGRPQWTSEISLGNNSVADIGQKKDDPTGFFLKQCRGDRLVDLDGNKFVDPTCPSNGSWFRNGAVQRYSIGVRGGTDQLTYALSGNFNNEEGAVAPGFSKDGGFRGNFQFNAAKGLIFNMSTAYNRKYVRWIPDGNNASGLFLNVGRGPFNNFKGGKGECVGVTVTCVTNGYILQMIPENRGDHFVNGLTANWNPSARFAHKLALGWDYVNADNQTIYPFGYLNSPLGQIWKQDWTHTKLSIDYAGSFIQSALPRDLTSTFSWGGQLFEDRDYYTRVDALNFAAPGEVTLASASQASVVGQDRLRVITAGLFLQEMVGWNDRLFLTLGMRVDGNSSFGKEFGLQQYPKASLSYVASDHAWFPKKWVQELKLRGAIGESGKAPGAFDAVRTWDPTAGDEGTPAFTPAQRGNPSLGPERTREFEGGVDVSAFNGRIGLEATAYVTKTIDALIPVQYPPSEGFSRTQLENVGTLQNKGIELGITGAIIRTNALEWSARANITRTKSEAVNLGGQDIPTGLGTWVKKGYPVPGYWGPKVTNADKFETPVVSSTEQYIGPVYPTKIYSFGTTVSWKDFTFDALGEFQGGHYLANWIGYQNARRYVLPACYDTQRALKNNDATALARINAGQRAMCAYDRTVMNDRFWIEKADFFKLRSVTLSHPLPVRWLKGARSAQLTISGRNLFRITDYTGSDPEVQDARDAGGALGRRDYYNLPPTKSVLMALKVNF